MLRNIRIYSLISLCLYTWYIIVLWGVMNPNVCLEYRLYYLERKLTDWPGYGGLKYRFGEVLSYGTRESEGKRAKNRGLGWAVAEEWGAWTLGENADLYFTLNDVPDSDLNLVMKATSFSPGGRLTVDVFGNENYLGTLSIEHLAPQEYYLTIPARLATGTPFHLQFVIHNPSSPQRQGLSSDKRLLGLGLHWVKIVPCKQFHFLSDRNGPNSRLGFDTVI
ncbi:MAG: hypothetical protein P4N59_16285 [Negativicutes bacterium]|nr:hypothetical protein [Negativicutes bacterium]